MNPNTDPYEIDPKFRAEFTTEKYNEYFRVFRQFDLNKNGSITKEEIIKGKKKFFIKKF